MKLPLFSLLIVCAASQLSAQTAKTVQPRNERFQAHKTVGIGEESELRTESFTLKQVSGSSLQIQIPIPVEIDAKYSRYYIVNFAKAYVEQWNSYVQQNTSLGMFVKDAANKKIVAAWKATEIQALDGWELSEEETPSAVVRDTHRHKDLFFNYELATGFLPSRLTVPTRRSEPQVRGLIQESDTLYGSGGPCHRDGKEKARRVSHGLGKNRAGSISCSEGSAPNVRLVRRGPWAGWVDWLSRA